MRLSYDHENGELSIYVKREEFDLAARDNEYRVFKRTFTIETLEEFIKGYSDFIKQIFNYLIPNEEVKDIITLSTSKSGYGWRSLINLDDNDENNSFLETMFDYSLYILNKENQDKKDGKTLHEYINKKDSAKLSIIATLLDLPSLMADPYKKRKRTKNKKTAQKKYDKILEQIKSFEEKYKFDSETMMKYYIDDKLPDDNMKEWIQLYQEKEYLDDLKDREKMCEEFIEKWLQKP